MNVGATFASWRCCRVSPCRHRARRRACRGVAQSDARSGDHWRRISSKVRRSPSAFTISGATRGRYLSEHGGTLYGDQSIFVRREVFLRMQGFAQIPLMEDVEFSKRLRAAGKLAILDPPVSTSARRHAKKGAWRTTIQNGLFILLYKFGVSPVTLHRWYYREVPRGSKRAGSRRSFGADVLPHVWSRARQCVRPDMRKHVPPQSGKSLAAFESLELHRPAPQHLDELAGVFASSSAARVFSSLANRASAPTQVR